MSVSLWSFTSFTSNVLAVPGSKWSAHHTISTNSTVFQGIWHSWSLPREHVIQTGFWSNLVARRVWKPVITSFLHDKVHTWYRHRLHQLHVQNLFLRFEIHPLIEVYIEMKSPYMRTKIASEPPSCFCDPLLCRKSVLFGSVIIKLTVQSSV